MLQRDLCLYKGKDCPIRTMLSLFTVLRLVQLSLLAHSGECALRGVSSEYSCSETQLHDPGASGGGSQDWRLGWNGRTNGMLLDFGSFLVQSLNPWGRLYEYSTD